ncbi:MAG: TSCPD domain-containing protein, partial [Gemmatimonadetes bacterium]|nr:TSCPD domain-containing protein [Gemmatimonadota bacterium]
ETFRTAHEFTPEWHVRLQAAFLEHVVSAISKTTNFPFEATRQDVRKIYEMAFALGCKGVTVYRDGCRPMQVLSTGKTGQENTAADSAEVEMLTGELADAREKAHRLEGELEEIRKTLVEHDREVSALRHKRERPSMLKGRTIKMVCPLGDLYVTVNEDDTGRPFEVFCTLGKAGGAAMADSEAIGRLVSLSLRSGIPITAVRDQLRGISCDRAVGIGPSKVLSAPDAVAQALDLYIAEKEGVQVEMKMDATAPARAEAAAAMVARGQYVDETAAALGACPSCGASHLAFEEGCKKCYVCGYSDCG